MKENRNKTPWASIWVRPRESMRKILATNPFKKIVALAITNGIVTAISWIAFVNTRYPQQGEYKSTGFTLLLLVVGVVLGLINLYFGSWLLKVTGLWIKGKGSYIETKCAVGWSCYPFFIAGIFAILSYLLYQNSLLALLFGIINIVLSVWATIIGIFLLAEAHQFSFWRALTAILIAFVLVFVAIMLISLIIPLLAPIFR